MPVRENKSKINPREVKRHGLLSDLSVVYEGATEGIPVHLPDLSTRGMFINTPEQFPKGAVLKLHFRLIHSGYELNARAEVRHCVPGVGVGVEFVTLTPEALRAIEDEIQMASPAGAVPVQQGEGREAKQAYPAGRAPGDVPSEEPRFKDHG